MDGDRKIHISEGVPLNSSGAANIFLNTGKDAKQKPHDGTVIHLKTEKPSDLGVHINTTFSIASSKKLKLLFLLNFLLSVICMVLCCSIAFYYWNEMISMRKQLDTIRDHFLIHNLNQKPVQSALVGQSRPQVGEREGRMTADINDEIAQKAKRYYVEDLGEDMLLLDSKKKDSTKDKTAVYDLSVLQKELLVVHFYGGISELKMGKNPHVGPWIRDTKVSTKNSDEKIELNDKGTYMTIKESGLYLIYAQLVYLTKASNFFSVFATHGEEIRQLSACATGDDSSRRPIDKSHISCSVNTVARFYEGDIVNIAQREPNRTVWFRTGYSYFGFIKLSS